MRATACPNCHGIIDLPEDSCWRCEENFVLACGTCGHSPYDLGAGVCYVCGSEPSSVDLVPRKTKTL